ncbi:CBS domain-containing protein [Halalkalicoccus tibetensis]|uniref:CBS domain-containing protein n=1 Tax=Halalkalicoccus tibetensis TaxID=175632 RepID=A0ABD5V0I4_9EURY
MDISDVATDEYVAVEPDTRIAELKPYFEDEHIDGVFVARDGECEGVITPREWLRSYRDDETAAERLAKAVPLFERTANVRDVARQLVESETRIAPVYVEGELWGAITQDAILEATLENLDVLEVRQIMTDDVVTISTDTTLGTAINRLREHGVSRLPISEDGRPEGMVTVKDIVDFVLRTPDRPTDGTRGGEDLDLIDLPVYDEMSRPAQTIGLEDTVAEAVNTMFEYDYDGLIVSPDYDERVAGVVTKTDVMRALSYTQEEGMDVQITNIDALRSTSREEVGERLLEISDKHRTMDVHHVHVRFKEHDESLRGQALYRCQVRMRTSEGQIAGTGEGYGGDEAFSLALETLERNVLERKGKRSDEEYRGQLLRKLGGL